MNFKKKILFFHHSHLIGGAGLSGLNVLKAIPKENYEIIIYCNSTMAGMAEVYEEAGFSVVFAGKSPVSISHYSGGEVFALSPQAIINYWRMYLDKKRIAAILYKIKPDIVIVNSMTLFWIGKIAKKINAETVCFFRETYAKNLLGLRNKIIRYNLSTYFDKIAFISKYDYSKSRDIKCRKTVIYNMVPVKDFQTLSKPLSVANLGLKESDFNVLYLGGISRLKGAIIALKALSLVKNKRIKLIFVGYKWNGCKKNISDFKGFRNKIKYILGLNYEANCIKYIIRKNLQEKISFFETQKEIAPFYVACDALISPSTRPHQARPIFEAGLAKIPVIASDFPNIREAIDEESGFLFKNMDFCQLAVILDTISKDINIAKKKVDTNYYNTLNRHTAEGYNPQIVNLISEGI